MECFLQYLDDLDDFYGMLGLVKERLRRILFVLYSWLSLAVVALSGIWLAMAHAPLALATSILLFVSLLYRSVTSPSRRWSRAA